jgi:hypothetical protein
MALDEVIAIVGVPPGHYTTVALSQEGNGQMFLMQLGPIKRAIELKVRRWEYWFCDTGGLAICFEDGKVSSSRFEQFPWTIKDKLRGWLRLR